MILDGKIPTGPLADKWERRRHELKLVSPANKRKYVIIVVGPGLAGASAAAFLLKAVVPEETWRAVALGTPALARDFPSWAAMSLEAVTTFFLVLVVFATAVDEKGTFKSIAGFGIGLTISLGILVAGPFTGGALNPARAFGPALAATHWANWGVYWVGPLAGGFLAGLLYDSLFLKKA